MSSMMKGIISGFIATLVLSVAMLLKVKFHLVPEQLSIMALLGRIAGGVGNAWADHFIIGSLVWGLLYAGFEATVDRMPHWLKGTIFGVIAWLVMMLVFMPIAGVGLFGQKLGILAAVVTLIHHLIYGVALGVTYGMLTAWSPAKTDEQAAPPRRQKAAS